MVWCAGSVQGTDPPRETLPRQVFTSSWIMQVDRLPATLQNEPDPCRSVLYLPWSVCSHEVGVDGLVRRMMFVRSVVQVLFQWLQSWGRSPQGAR